MKATTIRFFLLILLLSMNQISFAQKRIAIYVQNASSTANVQWGKMTHLVHAFFNPMDNTGNCTSAAGVPNNSPNAWFITANFTAMVTAARTANPNIKIIISTGGAPAPGDMNITTRLNTILADATARTELANDLAAFVQQYNLDGWDFDLEHPVSVAEKNNHELFLSMMRTRLDALESTLCKDLEISIALNGETDQFVVDPSGADYVNPTVNPYVDFYHLMTYDASYAAHQAIDPTWPANHSPLIHAQEAVRDFSNPPFNWPKSKMVIGIPFYGRSGGTTSNYSAINSSLSATIYNNDLSGGYNYNGCATITNKVNFSKSEGLAGIVVWEGSQDLNNSTGYSLASCAYTAMGAPNAWEKTCCEEPNLGNDLLTCNTGFPITLNSNTSASGATYVWTRIAPSAATINASGSNTQVISSGDGAGTYVVARTAGTCTRRDTIIITSAATLPVPALGADRSLCTVPYTITPSNVSSFPPGTAFQWKKAGSNITGETNSTLYASSPATYTLEATLTGCTTTSDDIAISASSITPVDACRTTSGTLSLSVTGGTGPYTWYAGDLPDNTVLTTGSSYTTPTLSLPSTTYYYVEDAGAVTNVTIGETAAVPTGFANAVTDPPVFGTNIGMEFVVNNPVKLKSVNVFPWGGATYPFSFAIEIYNDHNYIVYTSATTTYAVWPGATAQVITLNAHLPKGKYRIRAVKSGGTNVPAFFHHNTSAFIYGAAQDLSIQREVGVAQYGPFYSWVIGDYNGCPRVRVRAEVAASCSGSFLPVTLSYFEVEKSGTDVVLEWATQSEKDNAEFLVERSVDGSNFSTLARLEGAGTTEVSQSYAHIDRNAPQTILYYRLAQRDIDGKVSFSEIKTIDNTGNAEVSISPNPFAQVATVSFKNIAVSKMKIIDVQGKLIQEVNVTNEQNTLEIGAGLSSGFYILELQSDVQSVQYKFVKD